MVLYILQAKFMEILEIIYKYSRDRIKIFVKNYERKVKNKYKKIFKKENFEI